TSAGASFGQLLKPKVIRNIIHNMGKIPAQRKSNYQILKTFSNDDYFDDDLLDISDSQDFGSYKELIKMDRFRFKKH
ncbi:MAG TPA: 7,8-didemethyl-8-hydroxy-5-deazariboflavin synthase subunit CofH, partial [Nitrososphaeraceae archaeon]